MKISLRTRLAVRGYRSGIAAAVVATAPLRRAQLAGLALAAERYGAHPLEAIDRLEDPRAGAGVGTKASADRRVPVVYVHGGGWVSGQRRLYNGELGFLARAGHTVWNLDYPLAPEAPFPGPLRSVLRALAWLKGPPRGVERVALMGDSAGGNLVAMAAILLAEPERLAGIAEDPDPARYPEIARVVALYGVHDRHSWVEDGFPGARPFLESYGGAAAFARERAAANAFTPLDLDFVRHPPMLLVAGATDPLRRSTDLLAERLRAGGGSVAHRTYPGEGHAFFNLPWSRARRACKRDALAFLAEG